MDAKSLTFFSSSLLSSFAVGGVGSNEPELVDGGIGMAGATGIAIGGCRAAIVQFETVVTLNSVKL